MRLRIFLKVFISQLQWDNKRRIVKGPQWLHKHLNCNNVGIVNELYLLVVCAVKFGFYVHLHNKSKNKHRFEFEVLIFYITFVKTAFLLVLIILECQWFFNINFNEANKLFFFKIGSFQQKVIVNFSLRLTLNYTFLTFFT